VSFRLSGANGGIYAVNWCKDPSTSLGMTTAFMVILQCVLIKADNLKPYNGAKLFAYVIKNGGAWDAASRQKF